MGGRAVGTTGQVYWRGEAWRSRDELVSATRAARLTCPAGSSTLADGDCDVLIR